VRAQRLAGLLVGRARDEDQQRGRTAAPDLIAFDEQAEECRPLWCVAVRVEDAPWMCVPGRWRPAGGLEQREQFRVGYRFARHGARRPSVDEQRIDGIVGCSSRTSLAKHQ
jgi:hypothetical protein